MNLTEVQIKNFRSIKDEKVRFSPNCIVLLGKNEAGKSNVLKAIAAAFGEYQLSDKDKRKKIDNEVIDKNDYYIRAVFKLNADDFKEIVKRFKAKYTGTENISFKSGILLQSYIGKVFHEILLQVSLTNKTQRFLHWQYSGTDVALKIPLKIEGNSISATIGDNFDLEGEIMTIIKELYNEKPIRCHYWQYKDDYLLPNSIEIEKFVTNPSKYKALENIFHLCDRNNIKEEFDNAIAEDEDYSNLLDQVSKKVTSTFQKIWKDFKGTSILLSQSGEEIQIKVVGKVRYNFTERSDGFKKFISILLMLSTQYRTNKILENDIILMDEPDQSLYPTSARHLKEELIEISKKTKVIYSTHSPYMIDSACLDRHIVVEKKDDITTLKVENRNAPYTKDELLRQAIDASIFDCIKDKNIIFEGYLDSELFNKHILYNPKNNNFEDVGKVYLSGISSVEPLTQILTLANKKFVVVADSDKASKDRRAEFSKNFTEHKESWLAYGDVCSNVSTMEDFISQDHIKAHLKENKYDTTAYDDSKNAMTNLEKIITDKEKRQEFKKALVSAMEKPHIENSYQSFVNKLEEKIKAM